MKILLDLYEDSDFRAVDNSDRERFEESQAFLIKSEFRSKLKDPPVQTAKGLVVSTKLNWSGLKIDLLTLRFHYSDGKVTEREERV